LNQLNFDFGSSITSTQEGMVISPFGIQSLVCENGVCCIKVILILR